MLNMRNLNKSLNSCNKKLKLDYANLSMKYQELDLAFDAMDEELKETQKEVIKLLLGRLLLGWSRFLLGRGDRLLLQRRRPDGRKALPIPRVL